MDSRLENPVFHVRRGVSNRKTPLAQSWSIHASVTIGEIQIGSMLRNSPDLDPTLPSKENTGCNNLPIFMTIILPMQQVFPHSANKFFNGALHRPVGNLYSHTYLVNSVHKGVVQHRRRGWRIWLHSLSSKRFAQEVVLAIRRLTSQRQPETGLNLEPVCPAKPDQVLSVLGRKEGSTVHYEAC